MALNFLYPNYDKFEMVILKHFGVMIASELKEFKP